MNVPAHSVPFACAARCPEWLPEIALIASTHLSAREAWSTATAGAYSSRREENAPLSPTEGAAHDGLRADPLRGRGPRPHDHAEPARPAERLDADHAARAARRIRPRGRRR